MEGKAEGEWHADPQELSMSNWGLIAWAVGVAGGSFTSVVALSATQVTSRARRCNSGQKAYYRGSGVDAGGCTWLQPCWRRTIIFPPHETTTSVQVSTM